MFHEVTWNVSRDDLNRRSKYIFGIIFGKRNNIIYICHRKTRCGWLQALKKTMIDSSAFQGKKAAYFTLGCKLNFSETSTFGEMLRQMGVRTAEEGEEADLCIINTCSVTDVADHKCRQAIRRMARENPKAFVVITGCYAQLEPEIISQMEGVDLVLGSNEKANLVQFLSEKWGEAMSLGEERESLHEHYTLKTKDIRSFAPSCSRGNRTRYFLKVQDGCDCFCTYCTIPLARGRSRNPSIASIVEQARKAASEGAKEIVLTGVNIGDFGKTTNESFLELLKRLDEIEGIRRYRISSLEPDLISDDLISWCSGSRAFMPHFHIPLQSGSDRVLRLMGRHYDTKLFAERIEAIKSAMPRAFIGVDVMAGCRGETEEMFMETFGFIDGLDISQLHVFPYSERPHTAALRIPLRVGNKEKKERCGRLLELSARKTKAFYERQMGKEADVLFEKASKGRAIHGFTDNYVRVELPAKLAADDYDNQIKRVGLGGFSHDGTSLIATKIY